MLIRNGHQAFDHKEHENCLVSGSISISWLDEILASNTDRIQSNTFTSCSQTISNLKHCHFWVSLAHLLNTEKCKTGFESCEWLKEMWEGLRHEERKEKGRQKPDSVNKSWNSLHENHTEAALEWEVY